MREKALRESKASDGTDAYYLAAIRSKMGTPASMIPKEDHSAMQSHTALMSLASLSSTLAMTSNDPGLITTDGTGNITQSSRPDTRDNNSRDNNSRDNASNSKSRKSLVLPTMKGSASTSTIQTIKSNVKK